VRVHSVHLIKIAKWLPTLRPSHLTWAVSPPVGCYHLRPPLPFIIITQPESWYSITVPRRVEGWVALGSAGRVCSAQPVPKAVNQSVFFILRYTQLPTVRFDPRTSRTAVRHATAGPLWPANLRSFNRSSLNWSYNVSRWTLHPGISPTQTDCQTTTVHNTASLEEYDKYEEMSNFHTVLPICDIISGNVLLTYNFTMWCGTKKVEPLRLTLTVHVFKASESIYTIPGRFQLYFVWIQMSTIFSSTS